MAEPKKKQDPAGLEDRLRNVFLGSPLRVPAEASEWARSLASCLRKIVNGPSGTDLAPLLAALSDGLSRCSRLQMQKLAGKIGTLETASLLMDATKDWPSPDLERFCFEIGRLGDPAALPAVTEALSGRATAAAFLALEGVAERPELNAGQLRRLQIAVQAARRDLQPAEEDTWGLGLDDLPDGARVSEVLDGLGSLTARPLLDQYLAVRLLGSRNRAGLQQAVAAEEDIERLGQVDRSLWAPSRLAGFSPHFLGHFLVLALKQEADLNLLLKLLDGLAAEEAPARRVVAELQRLTREELAAPDTKVARRSCAVKIAGYLLKRKLQDEDLPLRLARWWNGTRSEGAAEARSSEVKGVAALLRREDFVRFWGELSDAARIDLLPSLTPERLAEAAAAEASLGRRGGSRLNLLGAFRDAETPEMKRKPLADLTRVVVWEELQRDHIAEVTLERCSQFMAKAGLQTDFEAARLEFLGQDRRREDIGLLLDWMFRHTDSADRIELLIDWLSHRSSNALLLDRLASELTDFSVSPDEVGPKLGRLDPKSLALLHKRLRQSLEDLGRKRAELQDLLPHATRRAEAELAAALEPLLKTLHDRWQGAPNLQLVVQGGIQNLHPETPADSTVANPEVTAAPPPTAGSAVNQVGDESAISDLLEFLATRWRKWTDLALPDLDGVSSPRELVETLLEQVDQEFEPAERDEVLQDVGLSLMQAFSLASKRDSRHQCSLLLLNQLASLVPALRASLLALATEYPKELREALEADSAASGTVAAKICAEALDIAGMVRELQDCRSAVDRLQEQLDELPQRVRLKAAQSLQRTTENIEEFLCHYLDFRRSLRRHGLDPVTEDLLKVRRRSDLPAGTRIIEDDASKTHEYEIRTMGFKVGAEVAVQAVTVPVRD